MTNKARNEYFNTLEYISFTVALNWLNGRSKIDKEILEQALVQACINGNVKYRINNEMHSISINDFLSATLSKAEFIKNNGIELEQKSFIRWVEKMENDNRQNEPDVDIDPRKEKTYKNIIGALLACITGDHKDEKFSSETELREFLADIYFGRFGITERTLAEKFSEAKKSLKEI